MYPYPIASSSGRCTRLCFCSCCRSSTCSAPRNPRGISSSSSPPSSVALPGSVLRSVRISPREAGHFRVHVHHEPVVRALLCRRPRTGRAHADSRRASSAAMRRIIAIAISVAASATAQSQAVRVEGRIVDSANAHPVNAAVIRLLSAGAIAATDLSRDDGRFSAMALRHLPRRCVARRIRNVVEGFDRRPSERTDTQRHSAPPSPTQLDRVVVTASRKPERTLDAPATVFTVSPQDNVARSTATHVDQLRAVPGLDVASGGIVQSNVVARGFNALFSATS